MAILRVDGILDGYPASWQVRDAVVSASEYELRLGVANRARAEAGRTVRYNEFIGPLQPVKLVETESSYRPNIPRRVVKKHRHQRWSEK